MVKLVSNIGITIIFLLLFLFTNGSSFCNKNQLYSSQDTSYRYIKFIQPFEGRWKFMNDTVTIELEIKIYRRIYDSTGNSYYDKITGWHNFYKNGSLIEDDLSKRDSSRSYLLNYLRAIDFNFKNRDSVPTPAIPFFSNIPGSTCYQENLICLNLYRQKTINDYPKDIFRLKLLLKCSLSKSTDTLFMKASGFDNYRFGDPNDPRNRAESEYFIKYAFPHEMVFERVK